MILFDRDWRRIFDMPGFTVSESKLQYFQFKFLHRLTATNKLLSLMGKSDSSMCSFCNIDIELIVHRFGTVILLALSV